MILIVGGAGYIGSHTAKYLNQKQESLLVFDNLSTGHEKFVKWGTFVKGDLANKEEIRQCFNEHKIDAVMHFSAFANVGDSVNDPSGYYENNVVNTKHLLDVMSEFGVKTLIFSSTCAVYGVPEKLPLTEDHPFKPVNPYGWSKLMVERLLHDYDRAYGLKSVCLRYFNAAGASLDGDLYEDHSPETHLIPLVLAAIHGKRDQLKIFGSDYETRDGTCIRDYIHVNDLAKAHYLALQYLREGGKSEAFNLGNGDGYSVKEVIETAEKVTCKACPSVMTERREGDPGILIGSSDKAKRILGWEPEIPGLEEIVASVKMPE